MARRYRVAQGRNMTNAAGEVYGGGDEIDGDKLAKINVQALVDGGFLEEIEPLVSCPACSDDKAVKKADVPQFKKAETLSEHYEKEHPALAAPDFEEVV